MNNEETNQDGLNRDHQQNSEAAQRLQTAARVGLDAATHGGWEKVRNAPVVGKGAQKLEEKLGDKLGKTKVGQKIADPKNHKRPKIGVPPKEEENKEESEKNPQAGDKGLKKSKNDKKNHWWNKKKKDQKDKNEKTDDKKEENDDSSDEKDDSSNIVDDLKGKSGRRFKIKVMLIGLVIMLVGLLVASFIMAVFGLDVSQALPAINPTTYGTDNFESTYPKDSKQYKNEIAYYKKLNELAKEHQKKYGEELDTNYIHATLLYLYLIHDVSQNDDYNDDEPINYVKMKDMVDKVYNLMLPSDTNKKTIDYKVDGEFYNNLKESDEFSEYYKSVLDEEKTVEAKEKKSKEIMDGIFELALNIGESTPVDDTTISEETKVTVTEPTGTTTMKKTLSITEYIADSIYASSDNLSNAELVKAYTIVYSTNIVADNKKLTISSKDAVATNEVCSITEGCSYNKEGKLVSGSADRNSQNTVFYNGKYYYKKPLSTDAQTSLNKNINSVFGNVLVEEDGSYSKLDWSILGGLGDGDYNTILTNAYGTKKQKNVGENSYILDASYGTKLVKVNVQLYDQKDYPQKFCGIKGYTIAGSGCGVTAMSMVLATYTHDRGYNPISVNEEARKMNMCGGGDTGTKQAFFCAYAKKLGYNCISGTKYNKSFLNNVLKHLSKEHLVVVRMGYGHFTSGGHYMVLSGVDPETKKVYVNDPNNKSNKKRRKTGNGWYSYNDMIVKEAYNFYIIWR